MREQDNRQHEQLSSHDICAREAWQELEGQLEAASTQWAEIEAINSATRAMLVSKKIEHPADLESSMTNCVGAFLHLRRNLARRDIELYPALVRHYPWQDEESHREIHVVGIVRQDDGGVMIADSTPEAGYSYGGVMQGAYDSNLITAYDEVLDGHTTYQLLTADEFAALEEVYRYEASPRAHTRELLMEYVDRLKNVASYKVRLLHVAIKQGMGDEFLEMMNTMPPEAIRKSYRHYLSPEKATRVEHITENEAHSKFSLVDRIEEKMSGCGSMAEYAYWASVRAQLSGEKEVTDRSLRRLNALQFAELGSTTPIKDYELFVAEHAPETAVSNLYMRTW